MKILVSYRGIPQSRGWATGDCVVRAFQALGHECVPYGNYYETQERLEGSRQVLNEEWDLLVFMECGDGERTYTELSSLRTRRSASWFFDAALYPERWLQIIRQFNFDANFIANRNMLYDSMKTIYLPYAADETIHFRPLDATKYRQFGFVGSDRPERQALANKLHIDLKSGVYREQFIDYLAGSNYTVNDIAGGGVGLIPMRPFEALAAGSSLITPKGDGVSDLGIPCIEYSDEDELLSICDRLRTTSPNCSGQSEVLRNHTYKNRCESMLQTLFPHEVH